MNNERQNESVDPVAFANCNLTTKNGNATILKRTYGMRYEVSVWLVVIVRNEFQVRSYIGKKHLR